MNLRPRDYESIARHVYLILVIAKIIYFSWHYPQITRVVFLVDSGKFPMFRCTITQELHRDYQPPSAFLGFVRSRTSREWWKRIVAGCQYPTGDIAGKGIY